jgi:hypothetical protein
MNLVSGKNEQGLPGLDGMDDWIGRLFDDGSFDARPGNESWWMVSI